jgi:hypothetical protein
MCRLTHRGLLVVIPEATYMFAVAGLNLSLAGLAGLVATLRRGSAGQFSAMDRFRLREIVEFSFANALFALAVVPMSTTIGSSETAVRILSASVIAYQVAFVFVLVRRQMARGLPIGRGWAVFIGLLNFLIVLAAGAGIIWATVAAYQWLLLLLLARPMVAFVVVLASFEHPGDDPSD